MVNGKYYDTLEEAIANASSEDIIELMTNVNLEKSLTINKTVNIDLNGNDILAPSTVFIVQSGTLNITGSGTIKEIEPYYGAIKVIGSNTFTNEKYSLVNIEKDVTLEGWSGISISHESSKSYGVYINLDGKINAISDTNGGEGIGIYVNGNIQDENGAPIINVLDNAKIHSNGSGLYIAGYAKFYINKAYIQGEEAGIGIKAGILNIAGATILCDGIDNTPTEGYNNGIKSSGTAIQIESNDGYAGEIELTIKNGNIISKNSNVIYEYIGRGTSTQVKTINIIGGTFKSEANKEVFSFSDSFKTKHNSFITGGEYSSSPDSYLAAGYSTTIKNNKFIVDKSMIKEVFALQDESTPKLNTITLSIIIIILLLITYFNKDLRYFIKEIIKKISVFKHK